MKALIVGNSSGQIPKAQFLKSLKEAEVIIAADGGVAALIEQNIFPHLLIGDIDSTPQSALDQLPSSTQIERHPRDKNFSDLELAHQWAEKRGAQSIDIFQWSDERIDYSYNALLGLKDSKASLQLYGADFVLGILNQFHSTLSLRSQTLRRISIGSLSLPATLSSEGLKWELNWSAITSPQLSLSNEFNGRLELKLQTGSVFYSLNS